MAKKSPSKKKQAKKAEAAPKKKPAAKKKPVARKKPAPKMKVVAKMAAAPVLATTLDNTPSEVPWSSRNYISIRLFCGAPNPRWEITQAQAAALAAELSALPSAGTPMDFPDARAYYGGMVVHVLKGDRCRRGFVVFEETVLDFDAETVRRDKDRLVEAKLFRTMPVGLNLSLDSLNFETASAPSLERKKLIGATAGEQTPRCQSAPAFDAPPPLSRWDRFPGIEDNNCYNFANNQFSNIDDFQPGRRMFAPMTEEEMHQRLLSDRLIPVAPYRKRLPNACHSAAGANLLAVAMRRRSGQKMENGQQVPVFKDFHCFRLDSNGLWSHKDGSRRSKNTDKDHNLIRDLATANFDLELVLVGYYWSVPGVRRIGMSR